MNEIYVGRLGTRFIKRYEIDMIGGSVYIVKTTDINEAISFDGTEKRLYNMYSELFEAKEKVEFIEVVRTTKVKNV